MLVVSLFSGQAVAAAAKSEEVVVRAYLNLDAQGAVDAIEWPHMDPKSKPLTDRLEKAIRAWEFEPGSIDGVPMATRTGLTLWVGAGKNDEGTLTLSILSAHTGAVADHMVIPRYPQGQARSSNSASVTLVLEVDDSGAVSSATTQRYQSKSISTRSREEFETASRSAAMQWKFTPERVAGRAVPSQVRIPFDFCMDSRSCKAFRRQSEEAGEPQSPSGMATALDSVVRIKTKTTAIEI